MKTLAAILYNLSELCALLALGALAGIIFKADEILELFQSQSKTPTL